MRSVGALTVSRAEAAAMEIHDIPPLFKDPGLQEFHEQGFLDELLYQLKSGKEATVYAGRGPAGLLAVKVYTDLAIRPFRNDAIYRQGRHIGDNRLQKAIEQRSRIGMSAQQALWVEEEYRQLRAFHEAGITVPRPLGQSGRAIAMEFIGDERGPAPRLSESVLGRDEAAHAFEQCVHILARITACGWVHCDYSAYNILWWNRCAVVIDLPQVVVMEYNPSAGALLRRDAESLCRSFDRFGFRYDANTVLRSIGG